MLNFTELQEWKMQRAFLCSEEESSEKSMTDR